MSQLKSKAGKSYEIIHHNSEEIVVGITYNCYYCSQQTTVRRGYTTGPDVLESKAFFEELECEHCGKTTEIRYLPHHRITESEDTV